MSKDKPTDKEKQFTVLPNEADPKNSTAIANKAINKALLEIKSTRKK